MNRRKKGNQILKARAKKANAKLSGKKKTKYISKAERNKLETEMPEAEDYPTNPQTAPPDPQI